MLPPLWLHPRPTCITLAHEPCSHPVARPQLARRSRGEGWAASAASALQANSCWHIHGNLSNRTRIPLPQSRPAFAKATVDKRDWATNRHTPEELEAKN